VAQRPGWGVLNTGPAGAAVAAISAPTCPPNGS
jgi:hypothetical protein